MRSTAAPVTSAHFAGSPAPPLLHAATAITKTHFSSFIFIASPPAGCLGARHDRIRAGLARRRELRLARRRKLRPSRRRLVVRVLHHLALRLGHLLARHQL